jgi:hypothetical protein
MLKNGGRYFPIGIKFDFDALTHFSEQMGSKACKKRLQGMHSARLLATYSTVYEIYSARERCGRVFLVWPLTLSVVVNVGEI